MVVTIKRVLRNSRAHEIKDEIYEFCGNGGNMQYVSLT